MEFFTKIKKTLFDGDQEHLYRTSFTSKCSVCGSCVSFSPADLQRLSELPRQYLELVKSGIKGFKVIELGSDVFVKYDNLPVKYLSYKCSSCGSNHFGIFGVGEYQPCRFMLIQLAILRNIKCD